MTNSTIIPDITTAIRHLKILIIEDNQMITKSIDYSMKQYGFENISFAHDGFEAQDKIHEKKQTFDIVSTDFNLGGEKNGVALLKFLFPPENKNNPKLIIYTIEDLDEVPGALDNCAKYGYELLRKTEGHENLIEAFVRYFKRSIGLPSNPKYAHMDEKTLLIYLSYDLIEDLSKMTNQSDELFFSADSAPIKISALIKHIKKMTPVGKEYIGMWFSSQRKSLLYYERKNQLNNKSE